MSRASVVLVLVAACAGRAGAPARPAAPGKTALTGVDRLSCDDARAERLADAVRLVRQLGADDKVALVACVAGRFPAPGRAVYFWVDAAGGGAPTLHRVVLADGGAVLGQAPAAPAEAWRRAEGFFGAIDLVDFDGDGADEVVEQEVVGHEGSYETYLTVWRLEGGAFAEAFTQLVEFDDTAAVGPDQADSCTSTVEVLPGPDGRGSQLVVAGTGDAEAGCVTGRKVFAPVDGKLVER